MVLRIFKMIATSGFVTALERTKFVFGWGSAPDPTGGAYSAPQYSLAVLRGLLLRGRRRERGKERGRGEEEWEVLSPFLQILDPPLVSARQNQSHLYNQNIHIDFVVHWSANSRMIAGNACFCQKHFGYVGNVLAQ